MLSYDMRREIERVADESIAPITTRKRKSLSATSAWFRSDGAGQKYWYRVRKSVRRKLSLHFDHDPGRT
jgi:hypothetical protein